MRDRLWNHAVPRAPLALAVVLAAVATRCSAPGPPERTVEGVAGMLGRSVGGTVAPDDFVWLARRAPLVDALFGRDVLFLAARDAGTRDLYRARVRVTRSGRPMSVEAVHTLTETPLGDDRDLVARGTLVAFWTAVSGAAHGVTLLDLAGEAPPGPWWRRWLERADRLVRTGSLAGIARTDVTFGVPPSEVRIEIAGNQLVMALGADAVPAALDLTTSELNTGGRNTYAATVTRRPSWSESAAASVVRLGASVAGRRTAAAVRAMAGAMAALSKRLAPIPRPTLGPAHSTGADAGPGWPPPLNGLEGRWSILESMTGSDGANGDAAPNEAALLETVVSFDVPREWVHVVAIDMRRLSLGWIAGTETPRSLAGPAGPGRVPDARRVVAVWAGGPPSEEAQGAVFERRLLAPPAPGLPSVWADASRRVRFAPWPESSGVALASNRQPSSVDDVVWLRQLLAAGHSGGEMALPRSAMCKTGQGHLVYAWSPHARASTLRRAFDALGCAPAWLAAHPSPVGIAIATAPGELRAAAAGMTLDPSQALTDARQDAFFIVRRDPSPGSGWEPDPGVQPPPASIPAIFTRQTELLGATVRMTSFAPSRFRWMLRAGGRELRHRAGGVFPKELPPGSSPVAAVGLAAGRRRAPRGLAIGGSTGLPVRGDFGALVIDERGAVSIVGPDGVASAWTGDATELPLTADDARLLPEGREIGSLRERAAACVLADGTFVVAQARFDSDEATTEALLDVGCTRVVALDRGDHQAAFVERAGGTPPIRDQHDATTLFALPVEMRGSVE